jgi:hypothetical protein
MQKTCKQHLNRLGDILGLLATHSAWGQRVHPYGPCSKVVQGVMSRCAPAFFSMFLNYFDLILDFFVRDICRMLPSTTTFNQSKLKLQPDFGRNYRITWNA